MQYQGTWNCSASGSPPGGTGAYPTAPSNGQYWLSNVAGTISGISYLIGDFLVFNASTGWSKIDGGNYAQLGTIAPPVDSGSGGPGSSAYAARADHFHPTDSTRAPLNSPAFTGTPSLPSGTTGVTQTLLDNSTKLATTQFVTNNNAWLVSGVGSPLPDGGAGWCGNGQTVSPWNHVHPVSSAYDAAGTAAGVQTNLNTHAALTSSAHGGIAQPSTTTPAMDGTAAIGAAATYAKADHVHPSDTSRAAVGAAPTAHETSHLPAGSDAIPTLGIREITFVLNGAITSGATDLTNHVPISRAYKILACRAVAKTAVSGANAVFDILQNGAVHRRNLGKHHYHQQRLRDRRPSDQLWHFHRVGRRCLVGELPELRHGRRRGGLPGNPIHGVAEQENSGAGEQWSIRVFHLLLAHLSPVLFRN